MEEFDAFLADCDADGREERNVLAHHTDVAAELEAMLAATYAAAPQPAADADLGVL